MNSLIQKIISAPLINDPWPHKIIDDFLEHDTFIKIQNTCIPLLSKHGIKPGDRIVPHYLTAIKNDTLPIYEEVLRINSQIVQGASALTQHFPKSRKYQRYSSIPSFHFVHSGVDYQGLHDEAAIKACSIVLYIWPHDGIGTKLHKTTKEYHSTVDWKPNRAVIFCGQKEVTWHNWGPEDRNRITLNFFLSEDEFASSANDKHLTEDHLKAINEAYYANMLTDYKVGAP